MKLTHRCVRYAVNVLASRRHTFLCASHLLVCLITFIAAGFWFQSTFTGAQPCVEPSANVTSVTTKNMSTELVVSRQSRVLKSSTGCTLNVTARNGERRLHLINGCQQTQHDPKNMRRLSTSSYYKYIFVDEKRRILYCSVPKVGSTNWKRVMLLLTGKMNVTRLEDLTSFDVHHKLQNSHLLELSRFKPDQIRWRINNYFKFLFVRHPLERIVSAYENKFNAAYDSYFRVRYGTRIIRQYRANPSNEALQRGHDVTFAEFVRYLGNQTTDTHWLMNDHWKPISKLCLPCQVRYDVIGKYETLGEDAKLVFDVISKTKIANKRMNHLLKSDINFPSGRRRSNRTMDVLSRFATVSGDHFKLMSDLYAEDFKLFGYGYRLYKNGTLSGYSATSGLSKQCV